MVESLFDRRLPTAEILARIRRDATLGTEARHRALALAEAYGHNLVAREADAGRRPWYAEPMLRPGGPGEPAHRPLADRAGAAGALALADAPRTYPGSSMRPVGRWSAGRVPGWRRIAWPSGGPKPLAGSSRTKGVSQHLGVAQYRLGQYQGGRGHTDPGRAAQHRSQGRPEPSEPGLPALAQYRLGQTDRARLP